ncbi:class I adenylate-forming enzyme family protein [Devosia sp. A369]
MNMTNEIGLFGTTAALRTGALSSYERKWQLANGVNELVSEAGTDGTTGWRFRKRPLTYDAMFRDAVRRNPAAEALVCGTTRLSYVELDRLVTSFASGLIRHGLAVGDRVAVMLDNRPEYIIAMLATIRAGGIFVPMGTRLGPDDVGYIVGNCEPRFCITAPNWAERFPAAMSDRMILTAEAGSDQLGFDAVSSGELAVFPPLAQEDTVMIIYTSGTTGKPKGACLTNVNLIHTSLHYIYALSITAPLRSLLAVPGTHVAGIGPVISTTFAAAGTLVLLPEFKTARVLETLQAERIEFSVMVPTMYQLMLMKEEFESYDLSAWIYGVYGGAIMPPAVIERFSQKLPQLRMVNAYGATETSAVCTMMDSSLTRLAPDSVGFSLHCCDLRVVDENGEPAGSAVPGELWIAGPNVSPGYWNDPEATRAAFENGYWKSGDIATVDSNGLVYIHDRLKDMINRGGFKVFSAEVENALMAHESVIDCSVIGVPDPVLGEKTFVLIQSEDSQITSEGLGAYLRARIADYKIPDFWLIRAEPVPRNQNGKHQKAEVSAIAEEVVGPQPRADEGLGDIRKGVTQ